MTKPLRVGLAGLGTVGARVARLLIGRAELLAERCGTPVVLTAISARDRSRWRGVDLSALPFEEDATLLAVRADVDIVVELIGGAEGVARQVCESALDAGKHVVTANKALIAHHGRDLAMRAEERGVVLNYEAAAAGGIPVIKMLREALVANEVRKLYGILNGTSNFILSQMAATHRPFEEVLKEAQRLGYAEADPKFDIDGTDAGHKLSILSALAFGCEVDFEGVYCEGIARVSPMDFDFARELGYAIKLLAIAEIDEAGLSQHVHPAMVPLGTPLADVDGVMNAVVIEAEPLGKLVLEGLGAGAGPTASAVLSDIADIARGTRGPAFVRPASALKRLPRLAVDAREGCFYLRLTVVDRPGVIAEIARILAAQNLSIESILQRGRDPGAPVQVVMITHETREAALAEALRGIAQANTVLEPPCMIRIEAF